MKKSYIYNKVKAQAKRVSYLLLTPLLLTPSLTSCLDTIILPDDKTVDEDFWQTKNDVASMVNSAYAAMTANDLLTRLIVWGDFRSDELVLTSGPTNAIHDALEEMAAVNMQTTNTFASWAAFYDVINRCNIVLERAENVMSLDPNYQIGDYQTDRSQMLALRALCYFYLVRNYRDVPYVTQAYMNSSQDMQVAQSAPLDVLDHCIADLEEAAKNPLRANGFGLNDWERVGWMTDDAINALLADIYLWRASVTHSNADYEQCVRYCDLVINSKKQQHVRGRNEQEKVYPLADADMTYTDLYVNQNAEESIFELQCRSNLALCQYLFKYASNSSVEGYMKAASIFGSNSPSTPKDVGVGQVFSANDLRYYAACYIPSTGEESYHVRKMISQSSVINKVETKQRENITYGGLNRNYIMYRLSDMLLMKAEAKVQLVDTVNWEKTQQEDSLRIAFNLMQAVHARSLYRDNVATDSMKWTTYKDFGKTRFETLIMEERLREFCFEGKRWYDLMRYNYRHIDYDATRYGMQFSQMGSDGQGGLSPVYTEMKTLMARSRGADAAGVSAKVQNEAYLYLPVPNADIIVCPLLKQNPAYSGGVNDIKKN